MMYEATSDLKDYYFLKPVLGGPTSFVDGPLTMHSVGGHTGYCLR